MSTGKSLLQLQNIFKSSPDAILVLDNNANVSNYNHSFDKLVGNKNVDEILGKNFFSFLVAEYQDEAKKDFKYLLDNRKLENCEYQIKNRLKKKNIDIEVSYSFPDVTNEEDFIIIYIRDISKRKINERAVINARRIAEKADELKTSFLANMSHEIRTPVNAIIGFADLLADDYTTKEEVKEYISIINTNGKNLLNLINDIIDVAKIESNQLSIVIQKFYLKDLFNEIQNSMKEYMENHDSTNLVLKYEISKELENKKIETDEFRLRQVLINLITNAIKFTDNGSITYSAEISNEKLQFTVKDTGEGLSEENLKIIFERFRQVEESAIKGGTGLGLTITKNLIELLKGKIWVKSEIGVGSEFYFNIPLKLEEADNRGSNNTLYKKNNSLNQKTILIVEDSETNYQLINVILKKQGANTIWATRGVQAINICKNNNENIDLILMDINLPDINGYECTQIIKSDYPNIPIIAQTAYAMAGEKEKSISFGCDDYLAKPLDINKLVEYVVKYTS